MNGPNERRCRRRSNAADSRPSARAPVGRFENHREKRDICIRPHFYLAGEIDDDRALKSSPLRTNETQPTPITSSGNPIKPKK